MTVFTVFFIRCLVFYFVSLYNRGLTYCSIKETFHLILILQLISLAVWFVASRAPQSSYARSIKSVLLFVIYLISDDYMPVTMTMLTRRWLHGY